MQFRKSLFINALLLSSSLIFCLIILELLAGSFCPEYNPSGRFIIRTDEAGRPFGLKNATVRQWSSAGDYNVAISLNKYGFRDRKDIAQATPDDYFVVGNSFPFGWGVPEENRFSNLLEHMIGVNFYNIAMAGAGLNDLDMFVNYAEQNGARIKHLIICVFMEYNIRYYKTTFRTPYTPLNGGPGVFNSVRFYFWQHSTLFNILAFLYHSNPLLQKFGMASAPNDEEITKFHRDYSSGMLESTIERLKELAQGYDTLILVMPSRFLWIGDNRQEENKIHCNFVNLLQKAHLAFVDPRSYFEKIGNPMQAFFKHDGHWNDLGHKLIARSIADHIRTKEQVIRKLAP